MKENMGWTQGILQPNLKILNEREHGMDPGYPVTEPKDTK